MGFLAWFRRTTFEGTIKREVGSVRVPGGGLASVRLDIQELEPKRGTTARRFRFSLVAKTPMSYSAMPFVLGETEVREFASILANALDGSSVAEQRTAIRP